LGGHLGHLGLIRCHPDDTRRSSAVFAVVKEWGRIGARGRLVLCFGVLKTGKPFDPAIA
jgi:hypothetical protein